MGQPQDNVAQPFMGQPQDNVAPPFKGQPWDNVVRPFMGRPPARKPLFAAANDLMDQWTD